MNSPIPERIAHSAGAVALFGRARPRAGRERELEDLLRSFVAPTRRESGCVAYHLHRDPERPGVLAFYEHWASGAALAEHLELPQMQAFLERRHELLEGDLEIGFLEPVEPVDQPARPSAMRRSTSAMRDTST